MKCGINTFGTKDHDKGYFVQQTNNEGYIVISGTNSFGASVSDAWLIKTDSHGKS